MGKKMSDSESSDDDLATLLAKAQKQAKSIKLELDEQDQGFEVAPQQKIESSIAPVETKPDKKTKKIKKDKKAKKDKKEKKAKKQESSDKHDRYMRDMLDEEIPEIIKQEPSEEESDEEKAPAPVKQESSDSEESENFKDVDGQNRIDKVVNSQFTQLNNFYRDSIRNFSVTIVIPASIVDNAQSMELKTYLVGQIAKAATIFCVNEIVVLSDDKSQQMKGMMQDLTTTEFFVQNLEYLETPQYLRKTLFPRSPALRFAGLMNPLDAPHHIRATEWTKYREGCVIKRPVKDNKGSWVNIGLYKQDCQVDIQLQEDTRVTVKLEETDFNPEARYYNGTVVSQTEPFVKDGQYWGYQVRVAHSINEVFDQCPFDGGYDLKIGDSPQGEYLDFVDMTKYKGFEHACVFFGGLEGIEGLVDDLEENTNLKVSEVRGLFNEYINTCPERGCRVSSLRTEESLLISLGALMPKLRANGKRKKLHHKKKGKSQNFARAPIRSTLL